MSTKELDFPKTALLFTFFFAFFGLIAASRLIAQDEGFYMYASRLVASGNIPYRDFFYPQMPLLPFVYGILIAIMGPSWEACRMLSALFAAGTGTLLVLLVLRSQGRAYALAAGLLFISSVFVFPWYVLVQTYPLAVFLLFSSWYLLQIRKLAFLAGIVFGLCVETRLPLAAALPAFLYEILRWGKGKRWRGTWSFLAGGAFVALPLLLPLLWNSEVFLFNNLGYHLIRFGDQEEYFEQQRSKIIQILFGLRDSGKFDSFQMPYLLWASVILFCSQLYRKQWPSSLLLLIFCLFIVHLTPDPPYVQYFACLIPFLILAAMELVHSACKDGNILQSPRLFRCLQGALCLVLIHYLWGVSADFKRHLRTGDGVIGIMNSKNAAAWNITALEEMAKKVDDLTEPGDLVFASWPGHIFASHAQVLPGAENHFGLALTFRGDVSDERLRRYRIVSFSELSEAARHAAFKVAVVQPSKHGKLIPVLLESGYQLVTRTPLFSIFRSPIPSPQTSIR